MMKESVKEMRKGTEVTKRSIKVRHVGILDDPGYETNLRTYENEEEEGILYDNLD